MKKLRFLTLALLLVGTALTAQDIHFSQFYMSPLTLNPAMTGVMNCDVRLTANYRNQWASVLKSNAYNTYSASYDQRFTAGRYDYWGVGATFVGDRAGTSDFSTLQGLISGSYSKKMGGYRDRAHYLVVGANVGVGQRSVDFLALQYGNQHDGEGGFDPNLPTGENFDRNSVLWGDVSAGLLWFTTLDKNNSIYGGAAFSHLNQPDIAFDEDQEVTLYAKYTAHAGGDFMIGRRWGLSPNLVTFFQGPSFELNTGTNIKFLLGDTRFNYQAFQVGAYVRLSNNFESSVTTDAIITALRFDYNEFALGFSYDINISSLRPASNGVGGFEFALQYKICGPERRGTYCPEF